MGFFGLMQILIFGSKKIPLSRYIGQINTYFGLNVVIKYIRDNDTDGPILASDIGISIYQSGPDLRYTKTQQQK